VGKGEKQGKQSNGYNYSCDIWSWGVLLCEIIGGYNPFYSPDIMQMYQNVISLNVKYPRNMEQATKDLLQTGIFIVDPNLRYSIQQIKENKVFAKVSWDSY